MHSDNPGGNKNTTLDNRVGEWYIRLSRDASNVYSHGISYDGIQFSEVQTMGSSATTVAKIGFRAGQTASRAFKRVSIDWFRVT
jgi:hypothetical protein